MEAAPDVELGGARSSHSHMWLHASGAAEMKASSPLTYAEYCAQDVDRESRIQIQKDLPRTFPEHTRFAVSSDPGMDGSDVLQPLVLDDAACEALRAELEPLPMCDDMCHALPLSLPCPSPNVYPCSTPPRNPRSLWLRRVTHRFWPRL
jgi:hypothetical protein